MAVFQLAVLWELFSLMCKKAFENEIIVHNLIELFNLEVDPQFIKIFQNQNLHC